MPSPPLPRIYLRQWRTVKALSQGDLAKLAGIQHATISRLENEHQGASPKTLRVLAAALGIEPVQLYGPAPGFETIEYVTGEEG